MLRAATAAMTSVAIAAQPNGSQVLRPRSYVHPVVKGPLAGSTARSGFAGNS